MTIHFFATESSTLFAESAWMNVFLAGPSWADQRWVDQLGWTLIHSLWQLTLIAFIAALVDRGLGRQSARMRYAANVAFLLLIAVTPCVTWAILGVTGGVAAQRPITAYDHHRGEQTIVVQDTTSVHNSNASISIPPHSVFHGPAAAIEVRNVEVSNEFATSSRNVAGQQAGESSLDVAWRKSRESVRQVIERSLSLIVAAWAVGIAIGSLRPIWGLWMQSRLQTMDMRPLSQAIHDKVFAISRRMGLAKVVRVSESLAVGAPMVVGYLRPMILLPASMVTSLTPAQLDSLLAHELAHVLRHDWLVNAGQVLLETIFFFHPMVWWLSRRIRQQRELCCDDLAIPIVGSRASYAGMLLALEEFRQRPVLPALAGNGGDLVQRIRRLLPREHSSERMPRDWFSVFVSVGILSAMLLGWFMMVRADERRTDDANRSGGQATSTLKRSEGKSPVSPNTTTDPSPANRKLGDTIVRGRVITVDGAPLPDDLKLQKRITGVRGNVLGNPEDVTVDRAGSFSFEVDQHDASVELHATSSEFAPAGIFLQDVSQSPSSRSIEVKLHRGFTATIRLRTDGGEIPSQGWARISIRNAFQPLLGNYAISPSGEVEIRHCSDQPLQIDLFMPGFEEQRVYRALDQDRPADVIVRKTKPTRLRIVAAKDGQPMQGARVHAFSRVRADSYLRPLLYDEDGPVWAVSDENGIAQLTTLCRTDPLPTNERADAIYAFQIRADGYAPTFIGNVRAGVDLGDVRLDAPLSVRGEFVPDATHPEHEPFVQWRQSTVAQGGADGMSDWNTATLDENNDRWNLTLEGLRPGRFDLRAGYTHREKSQHEPGGLGFTSFFYGTLSGNASRLRITRDEVISGDEHLQPVPPGKLSDGDGSRGNLPGHVVKELTPKSLLVWSQIARGQREGGFVTWRLFILQDRLVFVPSTGSYDAGGLYRLTEDELGELTALLDKHHALFGAQVPNQISNLAWWDHSQESFEYNRLGQRQTFRRWYGREAPQKSATDEAQKEIESYVNRLIAVAKCGGRDSMAGYLDTANLALTKTVPNGNPLTSNDGCSVLVEPDGTRKMQFGGFTSDAQVLVVHPLGGDPYVERILFQDKLVVRQR